MEPTVKLICLARKGHKQARSRPYIFAIALEGRQKAIIHSGLSAHVSSSSAPAPLSVNVVLWAIGALGLRRSFE